MTQSNKDDGFTITLDNSETIDLDNLIDTSGDIIINLNDTYGTTTTYAGATTTFNIDSMYTSDTISISDGTYTLDTHSTDWLNNITINDARISPDEVESMCKEYPALEKVWRNFKTVYDMVQQDYKGKKEAGELDDELPF